MTNYQRICETIGTCCVLLGIGPGSSPTEFQMNVIATYLNQSQRNWTCEQLIDAFTKYIHNELDIEFELQYQVFSPALIHQVMTSYKKYLYEKSHKDPAALLSSVNPPSPEEVNGILFNASIKAFENYKDGFEVFDFGSVKYNYLDSIGVIDLTEEERAAIWKSAGEELKKMISEESDKNSGSIKMSLNSQLDNFENDPEMIGRRRSIARYKALIFFFDKLIKDNVELKSLMEC